MGKACTNTRECLYIYKHTYTHTPQHTHTHTHTHTHRLAGNYEALAGGQTGDALVDFTGGVNDSVDIREGGYQGDETKQLELFKRIYHAHDHKALISCSISVSTDNGPELHTGGRPPPPPPLCPPFHHHLYN